MVRMRSAGSQRLMLRPALGSTPIPELTKTPDSRTVLGGGNEYLSAGADAIRPGYTTKAFG